MLLRGLRGSSRGLPLRSRCELSGCFGCSAEALGDTRYNLSWVSRCHRTCCMMMRLLGVTTLAGLSFMQHKLACWSLSPTSTALSDAQQGPHRMVLTNTLFTSEQAEGPGHNPQATSAQPSIGRVSMYSQKVLWVMTEAVLAAAAQAVVASAPVKRKKAASEVITGALLYAQVCAETSDGDHHAACSA